MSLAIPPRDPEVTPKRLVVLAVPALAIGVISALVLWALDRVAAVLQSALWDALPDALGVDPSGWWIVAVLTLTGLAVGLVLRFVPGHGGPDSATTELVEQPQPLRNLPGLLIVTVLALAGGVSLGPENPIIAVNTALMVAAIARLMPAVPKQLTVLLAASATIGALFGTPVAAALVFTGIVAALKSGGALWDRLFLPLVAAGAGAFTMRLLGAPIFSSDLPAYGAPQAVDLLTGALVASGAAVIGLAMLAAFPIIYRAMHALRHPVLIATAGGLLLGLLGLLGGPITMFKGLEQIGDLLEHPDDYDGAQLAAIAGIKILALLIAASSLFRGGRVFPATFIGVALGMLGHALIPSLPLGLAVGCAVVGVLLVVTRDGWIAIFVAVAVAGDITILPMLCVIVLPVWLLVTGAPEFRIAPPKGPAPASTPAGAD
ncbi:ion channel protein [Agromyces badenianii]|uniref:Ion channel protein n=1 Tax=Agromyces badenianii TaxID=2080742 RepID=A0A2S0WZA0_9MICO|nr:ion channel protein [Agromyces badenianii]AWB96602.1 ion channel protein [Agromyces badenianii]